MGIEEINLGDVIQCPKCVKEFVMDRFDNEDFDDFDDYFMHITTCEGL